MESSSAHTKIIVCVLFYVDYGLASKIKGHLKAFVKVFLSRTVTPIYNNERLDISMPCRR